MQYNLICAALLLHFASEPEFMATCDVLWLEVTEDIILERTDTHLGIVLLHMC